MIEVLQARPTTQLDPACRVGVPPLAPWIVPRPRRTALLDQATAASRLTVVSAAAGAGKTALVLSWVTGLTRRTSVYWLNVRSLGALPALPEAASASGRCIVVLDDFPIRPTAAVNRGLDRLLRRASPDTRFILVCAGSPPLDLQLLGVAGDAVPITSPDLVMDPAEIREVLLRHGVDHSDSTVRAVHRQTDGWACGVRLAGLFLQRSDSVPTGLGETDRAITRYLDTSVFRGLPARALDLMTATSVVEEVPAGLAEAVTGTDTAQRLSWFEASKGFVDLRADGSFRCHPLLRRALLQRLRQNPVRAREASRQVAEWSADQGDIAAAIDLALEARDWVWAGRRLVESLAVPRLLVVDEVDLVRRRDIADALGAAEPLLLAAAALRRSWPDLAERAIGDADRAPGAGGAGVVRRLSVAVLRMAVARSRADAQAGLEHARQVISLLPELSITQRTAAPELIELVQSHVGVFELWNNAPDRARAAFERGARAFRRGSATEGNRAPQVAAADCLGQLAWLEAIGGELNRATRHASDVLTARPANSTEIGVIHAQLATIWSHIARGELEQAGQRFESVMSRCSSLPDGEVQPGVASATELTAARLAVVADAPVNVGVCRSSSSAGDAGWFDDQLRLLRAEAELNAGDPAQAIRVLGESGLARADAYAVRARAWIELGDLTSAEASLRVRPVEALSVATQVQLELIEACLARAHGERNHERALIDRALRIAGREQLRTSIAWAKGWLHSSVSSDRALLQRHGSFLASIRGLRVDEGRVDLAVRCAAVTAPAPLTHRELEILQRLGSLSTNEEIATELFLSTNTVKTHLKSLYRKLDVTRRSEAFRRGRSLGLC